MLRVKLTHLDDWNARRKRIAAHYWQALSPPPTEEGHGGSECRLPQVREWADPVWHLFVIRTSSRDALQRHLDAAGVGTLIHYPIPPHLQQAYAGLGHRSGDLPIAEATAREVLSLPMGPHLSGRRSATGHCRRARLPAMSSYRQIFRSSAIIGGASAITIVIGIVKVKVLAVLLGPAGVGLMGLYQNIMSMASILAGCGIGSSGVRQLAASVGDKATLEIVRRTLWLSNLILGLAGMVVLWSVRAPVARCVFGDAAHAADVGWLGLGVLLTLIAGSQTALLQGLRRIGDLARVHVISACLGATVGILLVYWLGKSGVIWFVITAPAVSILVAAYYAAHLPRPDAAHDWQAIRQQWQAMLKLGIPLMAAGLLTLATQLAARSYHPARARFGSRRLLPSGLDHIDDLHRLCPGGHGD